MNKGQRPSHRKVRPPEYVMTRSNQSVHWDLVGPIETLSISQNRWILNAVDDYDGWVESYPLGAKSDVLTGLERRCAKHGAPEIVRTDNAPEFKSWNSLWKRFCRRENIKVHRSTPYEPQENGKVERTNRTLTDGLRAMLHGADHRLWGFAAKCLAHTWNRTRKRSGGSPYMKRYGVEPATHYFRRFGRVAYFRRVVRTKLQENTLKLSSSDTTTSPHPTMRVFSGRTALWNLQPRKR